MTPSIAAFTTSMNSPKLSTTRQQETNTASGRSSVFTIAKIAVPATSDCQSAMWMPGTISPARYSPARLMRKRSSSVRGAQGSLR